MKKRILSLALILAMIMTVLSSTFVSVSAADAGNKCGENLTWTLDSAGLLTISGTGTMDDYTSGKAPWYASRASIKKIVIEAGVESIGSFAFYNCSSLKKVTIKDADSFRRIGTKAFYYCTGLTDVIYCGEQSEWDAVVKEASWDYRTSATVSFEAEEAPVLNKCGENLTWTLDSAGVLTISGTGTMNDYASGKAPWYASRASIKKIVIEAGVESIGSFAFYNCSALKKVTIKGADSFRRIGTKAFYYCTGLTDVIYCGEQSEWDAVVKESNWDYRTSATVSLHKYSNNVCTECGYTLDTSLKLTVESATVFTEETVDISVDLANNSGISGLIVTIKYDTSALKLVKTTNGSVMSTMTSGKNLVFNNTPDSTTNGTLVTLTFEVLDQTGDYTVECIVRECANGDYETVDVTVTNGTITVKENDVCGDDLRWAFDEKTGVLMISGMGDMYDYEVGMAPWVKYKDSIATVIVENGVTSIGRNAFVDHKNIVSVDLSDNIENIGADAFNGCSGLASVVIPKEIREIGSKAFYHCSGLTKLVYCGGEKEWNAVELGSGWSNGVSVTVQFHDYKDGVCIECGFVCIHNWVDVETTIAPTHTTEGKKTVACTVCGMTDSKILPKIPDHEFGDWIGYDEDQHVRYCACGAEEYDAHSFHNGFCSGCGEKAAALLLEIESAEAHRGGTASIAINIVSNPGIQGMILTVTYDTNALMLTDVRNGTVMSTLTYGVNIVLDHDFNTEEIGTLVVLTFEVVDGANAGEYMIGCKVRECYNSEFAVVNTVLTEGKITISDLLVYGDADGNGVVNLHDSILIKTYLAHYNYETEMSSVEVFDGADANGDGILNLRDALLLTQYLANYDYDMGSSSVVLGPQS